MLHATSGHLAETASALTEHGLAPQTPVAITVNGTTYYIAKSATVTTDATETCTPSASVR